MPAKEPTGPDLFAELAAMLGAADGITAASVGKLTQRQLQDASKKLGLTAVSKLKKDALAKAVLDAWELLVAEHPVVASARSVGTNGQTQVDSHTVVAAHTVVDADVDADGDVDGKRPAVSHKFEVGDAQRASSDAANEMLRASGKDIPWGYGHDRVTAMPVDPDRLYVYWETLDESIARARDQLGLGGSGAWLNLRVYDTTGRIFDGTNAHSTTDHRIDRGDRQWFLPIGKPTSDLIIEIGMKSHEGYFVKIARSGRVEFPRRDPAPAVEPEWLTVRLATGQVERGGAHPPGRPIRPVGSPSQSSPFGAALGTGGQRQSDPFPVHTGVLRHAPWRDALRFGAGPTERHDWEEVQVDGTVMAHRQVRWESPAAITSWAAGPFAYPVETPDPVRESFPGKTRVFRTRGRTHVVHGPWQVVIRGLGMQQTRSVLSRWEVYRSWSESVGREDQGWGAYPGPVGASDRMAGSSERRWMGSSELRFGGSSELYYLSASELRLAGASERAYAGSSEWVARGASERRLGGASEWMMKGASERQFLGGSEGRLGGSSERARRDGPGFTAAGATTETSSPATPPSPSRDRGGGGTYPAPPGGQFRGDAGGSSGKGS